MFQQIFAAIKSFFASMFGGGKPKTEPARTQPVPVPPAVEDKSLVSDAAEVTSDTLVKVVSEMDVVSTLPGENFEKDIFEEEKPKPAEPKTTPTPPKPEATVTPVKPTPTEDPEEGTAKHIPRYLWCLDNGHGIKTPGKRSPIFDDGRTQFLEYEFNRNIVKRIIARLEEEGVKYFNVVPEVEIDDFLAGRVERANTKRSTLPKLYVSIHSNASPAINSNSWGPDSVSGIETWYFDGSQRGQKMASIFQKWLIERTGFKNRHLKTTAETNLYVLRKTNMTAILTENGFYNNKSQAAELMKDSVRQTIAEAHVQAILEIEKNGL